MTPDRKFLFACETESDQLEWISAFQQVIGRPMLPQEYAGQAREREHFRKCGGETVFHGGWGVCVSCIWEGGDEKYAVVA